MKIRFNKIFSNSMWMIFEKFTNILGVFFVTSYMAKYIGPENFGKITYVMSIFLFVQAIVWLGNYEILLKRVTINPVRGLNFLLGTQELRLIILTIISILICVYLYLLFDFFTVIFGISFALSTYFLTQDINIIYNNANLKSYYNTLANTIGLLTALFFRYLLVKLELNYIFFAIPVLLVTLIPYYLKKYFLNSNREFIVKVSNKNKKRYSYYYLKTGAILIFSTFFTIFLSQINILMLGNLKSMRDLGVYTAATTLGVSWSFINLALITAYYNSIYGEKNVKEDANKIFKLMLFVILISFVVYLFIVYFGGFFIKFLYGEEYLKANDVLGILVVATMFNSLNIIFNKYLIKERAYSYLMYKSIFLAILSIPISFYLVNGYGIYGAAKSTLVLEFLSFTLFNYFYKNGLIFKLQTYSIYFKLSRKYNYFINK